MLRPVVVLAVAVAVAAAVAVVAVVAARRRGGETRQPPECEARLTGTLLLVRRLAAVGGGSGSPAPHSPVPQVVR